MKHPIPWKRAAIGLAAVLVVTATRAGDAPAVRLHGRDGETVSLSAADLAAMPHIAVDGREKGGAIAQFGGVNVGNLLAKAGVPQGDELRGEWLRCHVVVTASDGYQVAFVLAEFDSSFTEHQIVLADTRNGETLDATHGPLQIIVPHEKRHSRWVRMVTDIRIVDGQKNSPPDMK